jgi:DNA-binding CsgD family transcriptional regulator
MDALAVDDVRQLSGAVLGLRALPPGEDFASVTLRVVARLVRADVWTWNEVDPSLQPPRVVSLPPRDYYAERLGRLQRFGELSGQHPVISYIAATGDGSARTISDFLSTEEFHALELYREVFLGEEVEHQISITLTAALPRFIGLAGSRSTLGDDFDERDRTLLDLLRPHLAQSYALHGDRDRLRSLLDSAVAGLQGSGTHAVVLAEAPYELTPGAMSVLYAAFGAPRADAPLPRRIVDWLAREQRAPHDVDLPDVRRPLLSRREGRRVLARLVPGVDGNDDVLLLHRTTVEERSNSLESLGLSTREAEILALVARGGTNASIAAELFVEPSTVKTHLEHVYRKLGVRSRAAAVAVASDLLAT